VYKPKTNNGIVKAAARTHSVKVKVKPRRILPEGRWNLYRNKRWNVYNMKMKNTLI
jgi:hypothetical protein